MLLQNVWDKLNKTPDVKEQVINIVGSRDVVELTRKGKIPIIMRGITDEVERQIDNSAKLYGETCYIRGDDVIRAKDIIMYGDFNPDSDEDLDMIDSKNLVPENGGWIYSNFDYDEGTYTTIERRFKGHNSFNPIDWFLYNHCVIGKPKKIIVYCNNKKKIKK